MYNVAVIVEISRPHRQKAHFMYLVNTEVLRTGHVRRLQLRSYRDSPDGRMQGALCYVVTVETEGLVFMCIMLDSSDHS
jgi:hypothetical protein